MEAHERQPGNSTGTESERKPTDGSGPRTARGPVPMRDLLASCAAADAVSTPPAPDSEESAESGGPSAEAA